MLMMNAEWQDWFITNVSRGCSTSSMLDVMIDAGFSEDYARQMINQLIKGKENPAGVVAAADQYLYDPSPVAAVNTVHAYDRDIRILMRCAHPEIITFGNVLSAEECAEIIERSRAKLARSATVDPDTGGELITPDRTSGL